MRLPPVATIRRTDTHRLVPSKHTRDSVLARIADDDAHLADLFDIDQGTNDRLSAEHGAAPGIGPHDLVFGVPYASVVNAAFCHPQPLAERLLADGSSGVVYPSVRRHNATCLACFRPPLVMHVRKGATWRFTWTGGETPTIARDPRTARTVSPV